MYDKDYVWHDSELPSSLSPTEKRKEKKRVYSRRLRHLKLTSASAEEYVFKLISGICRR